MNEAIQTASAEALQLEALLVARTYLYAMFHKMTGGTPSAELMEALFSEAMADAIDEYADGNEGMAAFRSFLDDLAKQDSEALLSDARDEYTRVFVGPGMLPASPYESPYRGSHDMAVFQESTLEVRRIYRANGVEPKRIQRIPDDHVSLMCHFAALRAGQVLEMLRAGDFAAAATELRDQGMFVQNHLAHWLPTYANAVRNSKAGEAAVIYPQLIEALAVFAAADTAFTVESSYWLEQNEDASRDADAAAETFAGIDAATKQLLEINLLGLEENELKPLA